MVDKVTLLKELDKSFSTMKAQLSLSISLDDLDSAFFIRDRILKDGFVSESLSRQISSRIIDLFMNWNAYFHNIIMPNPSSMVSVAESKIFSAEDKKEISDFLKKIMGFSSRNNILGLTKNKTEEGKFIEDSLDFWSLEMKPFLIRLMSKISDNWNE